jgi:lipopolysaccharide transport system ATP-binding protein
MGAAIAVDGLAKRYRLGQYRAAYGTLRDSIALGASRMLRRDHDRQESQELWALKDVSFEVQQGETLGVIGRNGAGKSTLLKILTRITAPTSGRAEIRGRVGSLLEVGTGFHPELTGRENIFLNGSILGMKRREITTRLTDIIDFAGIEKFIDTPVKRYSSGMYVRLAFSVAAHLEPEILLVDEVLAVGDSEFQRRCLGRMEDIGASGRTVLFVSHNMQAMTRLCDRVVLLDAGEVVDDGESSVVVARYLQSGLGTGSTRTWPNVATAPGDALVRLRSVRIVDENGAQLDAVDVRQRVGIEVGFTVLREGVPVFPKLKVLDRQGSVAFNAMDTSERWRQPSPPGDFVSTAWVPGNLLNEGLTAVDVAICSLGSPKLVTHAAGSSAVAFHVQDPGLGDSSRGEFSGQWTGAVRPLLDWTVERR